MQSAESRQCIYCREIKPACDFTTEHVIQQLFGTFGPHTPVLGCVCGVCNDRFGKTIDLALGRDSALGIFRYSLGLRDPKDFKRPTRDARVTMVVDEPGLDYGTKVRLAPEAGGKWWEWEGAEIGFADSDGGPYTYFPVDALPSGEEINRRRWHRFRVRGGLTLDEAEAALRAAGLHFKFRPPSPAPTKARLTSEFTVPQRRAVAKIGMNYLAYVAGPEIALRSEFDEIRAYINGQRGPGSFVCGSEYAFDPLGPDGRPRRGYCLTLQPWNDEIVVQVSIVSARFLVRLGRAPFLIRGGPQGHFLDLVSRTVEPMRVPELRGGGIRPPRPGEAMHLKPEWAAPYPDR
jgi:hypothetical protein